MAKTTTISTAFDEVIAELESFGRDDLASFIKKRKTQHMKKMSKKSLTPTQKENAELGAVILDFMKEHEGEVFTITDICHKVERCNGLNNQRVTPIVSNLKGVKRSVVKGHAYFGYSEDEETETDNE